MNFVRYFGIGDLLNIELDAGESVRAKLERLTRDSAYGNRPSVVPVIEWDVFVDQARAVFSFPDERFGTVRVELVET